MEEAIARARQLPEEDYLNWQDVEDAIDTVEYALSILEQKQVDEMAKAIMDAFRNLESKYGDKSYLEYALEQAEEYDLSLYTEETAQALQEAMDNAYEVMANPRASQDECDDAEDALWNAMDDLEYKPGDYSGLEALAAWAEEQNPDDYEDFSAVADLISWIYWDYEIYDQELIDEMADELEEAISNLVRKTKADTRLLQAALAYAQNADRTGVNELVLRKLNEAIANAKTLLAEENPAQQAVNEAWSDLSAAIHMLSFKTDKTGLAALVEECESLDLNGYQNGESKEVFITALARAKQVLEDPAVLNEVSIAEAIEDLQTARGNLVPNPDTADLAMLEFLVAQAVSCDLDLYLETGKEEFVQALAHAQAVLENPQNQEQVDAAALRLGNAWLSLRLRPDESLLKSLADFEKAYESIERSCFSTEELRSLDSLHQKAEAALEKHAAGISIKMKSNRLPFRRMRLCI